MLSFFMKYCIFHLFSLTVKEETNECYTDLRGKPSGYVTDLLIEAAAPSSGDLILKLLDDGDRFLSKRKAIYFHHVYKYLCCVRKKHYM